MCPRLRWFIYDETPAIPYAMNRHRNADRKNWTRHNKIKFSSSREMGGDMVYSMRHTEVKTF